MRRVSATAGFPSRMGAQNRSTSTFRRKSGRQACTAESAGVSRTTSPKERSRMIKTSAPTGKSFRRDGASRRFNASFVHEHHGDVVTHGINAVARTAFQTLLVGRHFDRSFANRTSKNVQQFLGNSHSFLPLGTVPNDACASNSASSLCRYRDFRNSIIAS